jgi:molecular chaperone HscB
MSTFANHFEVFDLPVAFDLDNNLLTQRYRELQRTVHPDNFANAPDRERRLAMQNSMQVNEAFQTLKEPLSRGRYLLQLQGPNSKDDHAMITDSEFLLEQMELREELASLTHQTQPVEALSQFLSSLEQKRQRLTASLSQQFAQSNYSAARETVQRLQFLKRLQEEALTLEEQWV